MKVSIKRTGVLPSADVLVLGYFADMKPNDHPWWSTFPTPIRHLIRTRLGQPDLRMDWGNSYVLRSPTGRVKGALLLGLGKWPEWTGRRGRLLARHMVSLARQHRWRSMIMPIIHRRGVEVDETTIEQRTISYAMADYEFHRWRTAPPGGWPSVDRLTFLARETKPGWEAAIRRGFMIGQSINASRDLANTPGGKMTPTMLAAEARRVAKEARLTVKILSQPQMKRLGMGAILGVARGSSEEPKFIILEYHGGRKIQPPLAIIGKGVTFDSGGLNLKPEPAMSDMHLDMSGGAAAIGAMTAMAKLKLPLNAVALVPAVENMPSGSGYRPGDLLHSLSGKVIEIANTDAEGRVILADAITYAQKFFKPRMIVDVATLTGAAVVALGQRAIVMFTNRGDFEAEGRAIGETSGDYVWPLPMWEEYDSEVKGTFGDVANASKTRYGGAINGAKFLQQFVDPHTPWVHLDIAPTMTSIEGDYLTKGATGTGVRWLVELARRVADSRFKV
ncbi:MAG: leucyl aminopeptidase family protein [Candidatus Kerfeldbacteria bacterium]|nr:leucyl aminopeptidase family protein [Candidatus Kerfeldbacteria bacterium]